MYKKLPPLKAAHYFAVASKLGSIKKASEALNISSSAITQQIMFLEQQLNITLLEHNHKLFKLTDKGKSYAKALDSILAQLGNHTMKLINSETQIENVGIGIDGSMVNLFLKYSKYYLRKHPNIKLNMEVCTSAEEQAKQFLDNKIDMQIFTSETTPNLNCYKISSQKIILVASSKYLENIHDNLSSAKIIYNNRKIHTNLWILWCQQYDLPYPDETRFIEYPYIQIAIDATVEGMGIFLCHDELVEKYLKDGSLVRVNNDYIYSPLNYYLYVKKSAEKIKSVQNIRDWILQRIANKSELVKYELK